jgi:hypothetical protein
MSRRSYARALSPIVISAMLISAANVVARPQEKPQEPGPKVEKAAPIPPEPPPPSDEKDEGQKAKEKVDKLIAAYDLKPHPVPAIPDDPPPHEGAMIDLPYVVEPPDLIIVEVLEALPGRPISGERLIRPDGKIILSFYGEIPVRGLTLLQVKVAIIKQLRKFINDETLGLVEIPVDSSQMTEEPAVANPPAVLKPAVPEIPPERNPLKSGETRRPSPVRVRPAKTHSSLKPMAHGRIPVRQVRAMGTRVGPQDQDPSAKEPIPLKVEGIGKGKVTITIEVSGLDGPAALLLQPAQPLVLQPANPLVVPQNPEAVASQSPPRPAFQHEDPWQVIPPEESQRVFVDITSYNSKNYYVQGLVQTPGRLPWTGGETVLDAIQFAGRLARLGRPQQHHPGPTGEGWEASPDLSGGSDRHPRTGRNGDQLPVVPG